MKDSKKRFYFRLNVPQRMCQSVLKEWTQINRMEALTEDYFDNSDEVGELASIFIRLADGEDDGSGPEARNAMQLSTREARTEKQNGLPHKPGFSCYLAAKAQMELDSGMEKVCSGPNHPVSI